MLKKYSVRIMIIRNVRLWKAELTLLINIRDTEWFKIYVYPPREILSIQFEVISWTSR